MIVKNHSTDCRAYVYPLNNQVPELYDLNTDFSQSKNIADRHPEKVKELKKLFIEETKKYQVFPMDASVPGTKHGENEENEKDTA